MAGVLALVDLGDAVDDLDFPQVILHICMARDGQVAILKLRLELWHPLPIPGIIEHHALDHPGSPAQTGRLCQIAAVTGGIERCRRETVQPNQQVEQDLALALIGGIDQLHHKGHSFVQVGGKGERYENRQVPFAGEIFPQHMAATAIESFQTGLEVLLAPDIHHRLAGLLARELEVFGGGKAQNGDIRLHRTLNQGALDIDATALLGYAEILLKGILFGGGGLEQPRLPGILGFLCPKAALDLADPTIEPLAASIVQADGMDGIRFAARSAVVDKLVKQVIDAVMGTDQPHLGAPHGQRHGGLQHLGQPVVESSLVDGHIALHPPQVGGVAGERLHLEARGEIDHEGEDRLILIVGEHFLLDLTGRLVVRLGPHRHRIDKLAGHLLVAAHVEVVATSGRLGLGCRQSCVSRLRPGDTGTAALLGDLERALVGNPDALVWQQHLVGVVFGTQGLG